MSHEVKRVSTSFEWPLKKIWKGYINPFSNNSHKCYNCDGSGYSTMANFFKDQWHGYVEFDPIAYGSELITPEAIRPFVTKRVDRSILEAAMGTVLEFDHNFKLSRTGKTCHFTKNGKFTREEAIETECNRILEIFNSQWMSHLIIDDISELTEGDRLWDFTRVVLKDNSLEDYIRTRAYYLWLKAGKPSNHDGVAFWEQSKKEHSGHWLPFNNGYVPTVKEVFNWRLETFGHDAINSHICIIARCKREGYEAVCNVCDGTGEIWQPEEAKQWADEWEPQEPPVGNAYQIWEAEESPISPAFSDPIILAEWMSNSSEEKLTSQEWLEWIIGPGWAPDGLIIGNAYKTGVVAMVENNLVE